MATERLLILFVLPVIVVCALIEALVLSPRALVLVQPLGTPLAINGAAMVSESTENLRRLHRPWPNLSPD